MAKIERVHTGHPDRPVVVFIHGLGGQMFDTWVGPGTSADDCWPHWIGQDTGCDTWVLGYDAAISKWQDQAMSLIDQAIHLAHRLATHAGTTGRDLVLVGHSMGGLLIKKMIAQSMTLDDQKACAIAKRVRGIVFIATPHQGAELASLVQYLSKLTRPNRQIEALRKDDGALLEMNRQFRTQRMALGIAVQAFAERREVEWKTNGWLPFMRKVLQVRVVSDSSSDPGLEGVTVVPLPEDHISIAKPGQRDCVLHDSVRQFIEQLIQESRLVGEGETRAISRRLVHWSASPTPVAGPPVLSAPESARPVHPPALLLGADDKRLQPVDNRFYGREAIVEQVLAFLRCSDDAAVVAPAREVSGSGGIGKTEVCKAALKAWLRSDARAVAWYLSLPDFASVANLLDVARRGLGLADSVDTPDKLLQTLPAGLYYLDNMESVFESEDGARLLQSWAEQPGVRLLVSSRVSLPSVFGRTVPVDRLPDAAALRLFRESWVGVPEQVPQSDETLGRFVLDALGAHPLSIVLCARLADLGSYENLVHRWHEQGTQTAHDPQHPTRRLGSLDASLSLTGRALELRNAAALPLWAACALFHGGVDDDTLAEMEKRGGWSTARHWLVRHHVLTRSPDGRWSMLPPLSRHSLDAAVNHRGGFDWNVTRGPMFAMFAERVAAVQGLSSSDEALAARRWLIGRFDTLTRLMLRDMDSPTPDEDQLRAMTSGLLNEFQFNAAVATPLLSAMNVRFGDNGSWLQRLGDLESRAGDISKARNLYERALALYKQGGIDLGQANALHSLGDLDARMGDTVNARLLYVQALTLFEKEGDVQGQANTLKALGDLEIRLDEVAKARALYEQALELYKQKREGLGQANTLRSLGDLESRVGDVNKASGLYKQALRLSEKESDAIGQANALQSLGDLLRWDQGWKEAAEVYQQALVLYARENEPMGLAYTFAELARCMHALQQFAEAGQALESAIGFAKDSRTEAVVSYVMRVVVEVKAAERAEKWVNP